MKKIITIICLLISVIASAQTRLQYDPGNSKFDSVVIKFLKTFVPNGNGVFSIRIKSDSTLVKVDSAIFHSSDNTVSITQGGQDFDFKMPYYARNYQTGKTANFNVISYTVPNDGNVYIFDIAAGINITSAGGGSVTTTITYSDEASVSRTVTFHNDGTATTALTAAGPSDFNIKGEVKCYPNTSVTITNTVSGTVTYSTSASLLFKAKIPQ